MPHVSFDTVNCTKLKSTLSSDDGGTLALSEVGIPKVTHFLLKCIFC
jgi:hypothetical protein